jgi:Leucine-rich repeat (LRR) protein
LAAERFVKTDSVQLLAPKATDPAWQPVILFAAALDRADFATRLLRELLAGLNERELVIGSLTRRKFFIVRYRNAAFRLDHELVQTTDEIARRLLPPTSMFAAELLAECGDSIVPHLSPKAGLSEHEKAACIRALRVIGTQRAAECLRRYASERGRKVLRELVVAASALGSALPECRGVEELNLTNAGSISDLTPLAHFPDLLSLRLRELPVRDLSPLKGLVNLRQLDLYHTQVSDLSFLTSLKMITTLNMSFTQPSDLAPLLGLVRLRDLQLRYVGMTHIPPMERLTDLRTLNLSNNANITDLSPLKGLAQLQQLNLSYNANITDLSPLKGLAQLQELDLQKTRVADLSPLAKLNDLKELWLDMTEVADLSSLSRLNRLTNLSLDQTNVTDVSPLAGLTKLTYLFLSKCNIPDLRPLIELRQLQYLALKGSTVQTDQVQELRRHLPACAIG